MWLIGSRRAFQRNCAVFHRPAHRDGSEILHFAFPHHHIWQYHILLQHSLLIPSRNIIPVRNSMWGYQLLTIHRY